MTDFKDQKFRRFDNRYPNHKMLTDSDSRVLKKYLFVPASTKKTVTMDISFDHATLLILNTSGNAASRFHIKVYSNLVNFHNVASKKISKHYSLNFTRMYEQHSQFRLNPMILPVNCYGQEVEVEIEEITGNNAEFDIYLHEDTSGIIQVTNDICYNPATAIAAGATLSRNLESPARAKFMSALIEVTDINSVNKDYIIGFYDWNNDTYTLESDMTQTENVSWFDLIPIPPGSQGMQIQINNDDGSNSITWKYAYLRYYF